MLPIGENFIQHILHRFPEGVDGLADGALFNEKAVAAVKHGSAFIAERVYQGKGERALILRKRGLELKIACTKNWMILETWQMQIKFH